MNLNNNGKFHGYNEIFSPTTMALLYRGYWKNGERIRYGEYHSDKKTEYYIR